MKTKTRCPVCKGRKQVVDRITNMPRACVACRGAGEVKFEADELTESNSYAGIVAAIKEYQHEYFATGNIMHLRPMRLKDIAQKLHVHPATVYYQLRNKRINNMAARDFFSGSVSGVSSRVIREMIIVIMDGGKYPDEYIAQQLRAKGVNISLRTVAKYRLRIRPKVK